MHKHFVHDDLEKERCRQREELEKKTYDKDFPQKVPVLDDRWYEPTHVEAPEFPDDGCSRRDENYFMDVPFLQPAMGPCFGPADRRVVDQHALLLHSSHHEKPSRAIGGDRREGRGC